MSKVRQVLRGYLFIAEGCYNQFTTDCLKTPDPSRAAACRISARIRKSKGTIVSVHVKDPHYKIKE